MAIIGISGKISSGKDTVGRIIQCLDADYTTEGTKVVLTSDIPDMKYVPFTDETKWQIKKFADKLKDIVCILLGCTREQLEDREFKEKELGEEWDKWKIEYVYKNIPSTDYFSTKKEAELHLEQYSYDKDQEWITKVKMTPRYIMQLIGTDCGRDIIHPNLWCLSLMKDYVFGTLDDEFLEMDIKEAKFLGLVV